MRLETAANVVLDSGIGVFMSSFGWSAPYVGWGMGCVPMLGEVSLCFWKECPGH